MLEFLERQVGHEAKADRIHELRTRPQREREQAARMEKEFIETFQAQLRHAREVTDVAERRQLLIKLRASLADHREETVAALKKQVEAELSVAETYSANKIQTIH